MENKTLELAEKICRIKFEEHFQTKFDNNKVIVENSKSKADIIKEQISLWETVGQTKLSEKEIEYESPIKQGLYFLCKQKIKWCTDKLMQE